MTTFWTWCARGALAALAVPALAPHASAENYHWMQYTADGLEVRAVTDAADCPAARLGGSPIAMRVRAAPGDQYPVTVCALTIPAGTTSIAIADQPVAPPNTDPRRILLLGDTGCRLKGSYVQACNDPKQWPFRLIAEVAAQASVDLIIHVGDYHYRETACPATEPGCAGSPFGDTWAAWHADFFAPAENLLKSAPWVFVRGNHEDCERGGKGWSRALDPYPFEASRGCNGVDKPYLVAFAGLTLAVVDTAVAREEKVDEVEAEAFREHYKWIGANAKGPTWLLQHRPIWSAGGVIGGRLIGDNKTLQRAIEGHVPPSLTQMISGHHHLFQVLNYESDLPVQIISGHGGDFLNQGPSVDPAGWTIGGVRVKGGVNALGSFGYALIEKQAEGWQLTSYDRFGRTLQACRIVGRAATCPAG